jgi:hypothetical protein
VSSVWVTLYKRKAHSLPDVLPVLSLVGKAIFPLQGGLVVFLSSAVIAASRPKISICSPSSSPGARLACAKGEGRKGVVFRRVVTEVAPVGEGAGRLDTGGKEEGPTGAGEAVGDTAAVCAPIIEVAIEAEPVGWEVDMPMPIFASCPALEIAMGKVGLCCECCLECRPAGVLLVPTPVPTLVGGLKLPSETGPVPGRADPGGFEEMCDVGGEDEDEPKEEADDCE